MSVFDKYYHRDNIPERLKKKLSIQDMRELAQPLADEIERLTAECHKYHVNINGIQTELDDAKERIAELEATNERLRAALQIPKWKSCHKDNMEFSAIISCYAMDKIRAALKESDDARPKSKYSLDDIRRMMERGEESDDD